MAGHHVHAASKTESLPGGRALPRGAPHTRPRRPPAPAAADPHTRASSIDYVAAPMRATLREERVERDMPVIA